MAPLDGGENKGHWKEDMGIGGGGEISLPACSAEFHPQVGSWSHAVADACSSRSQRLETPLCSFC